MDEQVKEKVIRFIDSLKDGTDFKFSYYSNSTILTNSFSIILLNSLGVDLQENINNDIKENLLSAKTKEGYFIDPNFIPASNDSRHKNDYIIPQFTFFTFIGLDILGYQENSLPYLKFSEDSLKSWMNELSWGDFWYESNKIMFQLYFYAYLLEYGSPSKKDAIQACIDKMFSILNQKQDPTTGLWGTDRNANNIFDGLYGAAHIFLFYDYFERDINYKEKIIDNALISHTNNGLVQTVEGGACEDYDLVEIYLRLLKQTDYRKKDIIHNISKMYDTINSAQNKDGGFSYRIFQYRNQIEKIVKNPPKNKSYSYSSWEYMRTPVYYSDIWATFFRVLTLGAIKSILENRPNLKSYWLPGWGYL